MNDLEELNNKLFELKNKHYTLVDELSTKETVINLINKNLDNYLNLKIKVLSLEGFDCNYIDTMINVYTSKGELCANEISRIFNEIYEIEFEIYNINNKIKEMKKISEE